MTNLPPFTGTDEQLIERVAVEVMGWAIWHRDGREGREKREADAKAEKTICLESDLGKKWNPLADWNHTMEVWRSLIERKLAVGIDTTEDHTCVSLGQFDSLGDIEVFECIEHEDAQRAICLAALAAVSSPDR